jgi:hypothetical protein
VPFLFPPAQLQDETYHDGALAYNNPTILAIEEAKLFWGPAEGRALVLSIGCGVTKNRHNDWKGPMSSCTRSFLESMSAAKQNSVLLLQGCRFTRLDPSLDMDAVSLDDFEAIPRLQQSFASKLAHDLAFVESLRSAAFQLLSSLFYFEVVSPPVFRPASTDYSITGMIRPRLPPKSLQHLYRHAVFRSLYFVVNEKSFTFSMPKKVNVRVNDLSSPLRIKLSNRVYEAWISGSPVAVTDILQVQDSFYRRLGSRKRRMPRKSSN